VVAEAAKPSVWKLLIRLGLEERMLGSKWEKRRELPALFTFGVLEESIPDY
jgi:hypothetical protein